jgi:hypothetical protein
MGSSASRSLVLAISLLTLSGTAALAGRFPNNSRMDWPLQYPGAPKPYYEEKKSPYPMNYADQAAQAMGVRNGRMDVFSSKPASNNPFMPSISGGLGGDGAMVRLQWRPGL